MLAEVSATSHSEPMKAPTVDFCCNARCSRFSGAWAVPVRLVPCLGILSPVPHASGDYGSCPPLRRVYADSPCSRAACIVMHMVEFHAGLDLQADIGLDLSGSRFAPC